MPRTHCRKTSGFTLVELVTTLVLIAILAAVAAPRMMDGDNVFAQRGYADEIATSIRYARSIAVATQCEVQVVVNAGNFAVQQRANLASCNNSGSIWTTPVLRSDGTALQGIAPTDVYAAAAVTFVFAPDGTIAARPNDIQIGPFTISVDVGGTVTVQS